MERVTTQYLHNLIVSELLNLALPGGRQALLIHFVHGSRHSLRFTNHWMGELFILFRIVC
jgi:hypothetical protein